MPGIKLQSALEFLTTYSFMFIIIAIAIVLVVVLASSARTYVPPECQSFGGLTCESDVFTSNYVTGNSILVFTLSNAQSAPINISYIKATANGKTALGSCVSTFVIPGTNVTCIIKFVGFTLPLGSAISGSYTVNGFFCNSGIVNLTVNGCTYSPVIYIGSFNTQTIPSPIIFDFGGDEFQHNVTLVPNSDLYLCGVSTVDYPGLYAFSWSVDSMSGPFVLGNGTRTWQSSIGHQTASPLCNVTAYGLNYTMVGASVLGTNKYVLAMHYARTDYINSFNLSYSVPSGVVGTVIIIACSTAQYCNTISIPAGCVAKARENPLGRQSTSYAVIALCATPQPKTYYISGNLKGAYISLAIAAYNIP